MTSKGRMLWLKGLLAATISGFSSGLTTGLAAITIAPETFNMSAGLIPTLKLVVASSAVSGITGASAYLKQSPLPPEPLPLEGPWRKH